jgi:hypothetical protein
VTVGSSGATVTLPATNGIAPTIVVPAGAVASTFTLTAETSAIAPPNGPNVAPLGLKSPLMVITLTATGGPSALAKNLRISIPASQVGKGRVAVVAVPDGKTGNAVFRRLMKKRARGDSSSSQTQVPWTNFQNGAFVVTDPYGTYTGSFQIFVINESVSGEDCSPVGGIGSVCAGAVLGYPFVGNDPYELEVSEAFYNTTQTDAVGTMGTPSCTVGTMGAPSPNPPGGSNNDGFVEYDTFLNGNLSNGQVVCDLAIPLSIDTSSGNIAFAAFASLQIPGLPTPTPSPSPSPSPSPTTSPTATPSSSPTTKPTATPTTKPTATPTTSPTTKPTATPTPLAAYRAQFSTTNASVGTWPSKPGVGPVKAIAAQINVNSQPFIYIVDHALGSQSGTITVTPLSAGSASFCTPSNFSYFSANNNGGNSGSTNSFAYPANAIQITLPAFQFGTDTGTCMLQFSDGSRTVTIPELVNPLTSSSFTGGIPQVPETGATFSLSLNTAAYAAAGLSAPSTLSVASTDYSIADLTAGVPTGSLGAAACNSSHFNVPVSISGSGSNYTLTVGPHTSTTNNTFCMVYIKDGIIGSPIDFIMNLTP